MNIDVDRSDRAAARKKTGIAIMLLVLMTAIIVSVKDIASPWLQILALSPVVPALMYFGYAARLRKQEPSGRA